MTSAVADPIAFVLFEVVMALRYEQDKPIGVADVLHVGETAPLAVGALSLGLINFIFLDQFPVDRILVFALRNPAGHIPPVTVTQVANRNLLNKSLGR